MRFVLSLTVVLAAAGCRCGGFDVPELPESVLGTCTYTNKFSALTECKDYVGAWTEAEAADDCRSNGETLSVGSRCNFDDTAKFGDCVFIIDEAKGKYARVELPGTDASKCGSMERGCELFGGGSFVPTAICGGSTTEGGGSGLPTFVWPSKVCKEPKQGEAPGAGPDGKVCTWTMISAATEEGRSFLDYGDCEAVRTQRPYYAVPPAPDAGRADPRLEDPAYVAELGWVRGQIESAGCVCCHTTRAPKGSSNWFVESQPNFMNSFYPRGLAMGAGWIDTVGFGAFPKEENNGFTRATPDDPNHSALPTTDDARMRRFFEGELAARGLSRADFAGQTYGAGPLDSQRFYTPTVCEGQEGVAADGTITWSGGPARYLYVLEANAATPGVPPNLDAPAGTRWRIDVPLDGTPFTPGQVRYGEVPPGALQRVARGTPPPLTSGHQYYLYVLQDIAIPITRCLFTAP